MILDGSEMNGSGWQFTGKNLKIDFFPLLEAEHIIPNNNMALISINDPDMSNHIPYEFWAHKITLKFHDIDTGEKDKGILFKKSMARELIQFVLDLPPNINYIVIHCFAGICRSGAVARFLQKHIYPSCFNETFWMKYMIYNRMVYTTLENVWVEEFMDKNPRGDK